MQQNTTKGMHQHMLTLLCPCQHMVLAIREEAAHLGSGLAHLGNVFTHVIYCLVQHPARILQLPNCMH